MSYLVRSSLTFLVLFFSMTLNAQTELSLTRTKLSDSLVFIYEQVLNKSYMIHPNVIQDERRFSFYISKDTDVRSFLKTYLKQIGYGIYEQNNIDFIGRFPQRDSDLVITGSIILAEELVDAFITGGPFGSTNLLNLKEIANVQTITPCHFIVTYQDENYDAFCQ